jgi:FkbH-like protein
VVLQIDLLRMNAHSSRLNIAKILRSNRDALGLALIDSLTDWDKYRLELSDQSKKQEFAQRETVAFVDYLSTYFASGDASYRDLYLGEKLKQCYDQNDGLDEAIARRRIVTSADRRAFLDVLGPQLDAASSAALEDELRSIQTLLTHPGDKCCRVLLIGDCLFVDILGFLAVPLMRAGIQLVPTFVTSKLLSQQHREIKQRADKEFDLIFYSPLTYSFNIGFSQFQLLQAAFTLPSTARSVVDAAKADIESTLQTLQRLFQCPILVHNSANLRRHDGTLLDQLKTVMTRPNRTFVRRQINDWLSAYLDGLDPSSQRFILLDETALLNTASEHSLSRYIYRNGLQHPAYFGQALTPFYEDAIFAQTVLSKKKVIICDLDDTLWSGTIGDGAVTHFNERQNTLQTLRKKGLLLAVCSKNDSKNIRWDGGTLSHDDFVCQQINWDSKSANIRRIAQVLNLKTKDFIFIDDRPDERALVMTSMPEITVLDAESARTWSQLSLLANLLNESTDGDRTLAYKQREERERFLNENAQIADDNAKTDDSEALGKLQLQLAIRHAERKELSRVSELINRTNQFNMCGSRTNLQEVTRWHESSSHTIWVLEARDRFGTMGTISIAVVEETTRGVEILAFVLSCRVFGYGMEDALINTIKRWRPGIPIFGHFKETPHNEPCRSTYPRNDFSWEQTEWVFRAGGPAADAIWLTIQCSI